MKALAKDLETVLKGLKALTKQTERIGKKLEKLEKVQAEKKTKAAPKKKAAPVKKQAAKGTKEASAMDTVLAIIKRSRKGVNTAQIKTKTGFNDKKIWNAINRLKTQDKIKSERKGVYVMK